MFTQKGVYSMSNFIKRAFTLAEVLIVVGIIGVTASLVVPNIKNAKYDKEHYKLIARQTIPTIMTAYEKAKFKYGIDSFDIEKVKEFLNISRECAKATDGCFSAKKAVTKANNSEEISLTTLGEVKGYLLSNGVAIIKNSDDYYIDLDNIKGPAKIDYDVHLVDFDHIEQLYKRFGDY